MPQIQGLSSGMGLTAQALQQAMIGSPGSASPFATLMQDNWEIIRQPLYDRVQYPAAGTTNLSFFSNGLGSTTTLISAGVSGSRIKTLRDTNMQQSGVMSMKGYVILGITIGYIPLSVSPGSSGSSFTTTGAAYNFEADKYAIATDSYLEIKFIDKPYWQSPVIFIPSPFESMGSKAIAAATTVTTNALLSTITGPGGYGPGNMNNPALIDPPFLLMPNENFTVNMICNGTALSSSNPIDVYFGFIGYMLRPAQ